MLDAISSGAASTPAALSGVLGLPRARSPICSAPWKMRGFVARGADGGLRMRSPLGRPVRPRRSGAPRVPSAARHRISTGTPISLVQLFGNQIVFVDVRLGRHPLPLTPRPGQRANAEACAGAVAILSSVPVSAAAELVRSATGHLGLSEEQVHQTLALRRRQRSAVYESASAHTGRQFACAVPATRSALTLHLPDRWSEPGFARKAGRALTALATDSLLGPR